ncbi:MAG TPA: hypothetical protein DCE33_03365 [Rhodospirillaceae bacterium]|nr:hypothetical protein [Rhodospirillaceae bacterium]
MAKSTSPLSIWTLTDGKIGMVNQSLGLAEALDKAVDGAEITEKTIHPKLPWRWLPPMFWPRGIDGAGPGSDALNPPWPDIVISCGRHAVGPALAVKSKSLGRTFVIHVQHPHVRLANYDLIAAPNHDRLAGPNVISFTGSMHRITPEKLAHAADEFRALIEPLPRPRIAVLIGGSNRSYRLTEDIARRLGEDLAVLAEKTGAGLMVTASRRTGSANEAVLRDALDHTQSVFWDNKGSNPYFGFLAAADAIIVTCDSVNMITEAAATGKPVHIVDLEGGDAKFQDFHQSLYDAEIARPFSGEFAEWEYSVLDEPARVANEVLRRMEAAKNE